MSELPKPHSGNTDPEARKLSTVIIKVAPGVTMVLAAIGVVAFTVWITILMRWLGPDVYKLTYQFLLLTVFGGAVSWLFTLHSKLREDNQKAKEKALTRRTEEKLLLRKLYSNIIQAYNAAKRARRLLRATARCFSSDGNSLNVTMIILEPYEKQMQEIIDIQLQFETFIDEVESNPTLFSGGAGPTVLKGHLKSIEGYLNDIIDEYENLYNVRADALTLSISKLPRLEEFHPEI